MANQRDQIAFILGIPIAQVDNYCQRVRAAVPASEAPGNQDIAKALNELTSLKPTVAEVAERATKIAKIRRASKNRDRWGTASRIGLRGMIPTLPTRYCSCGMPSIPGGDTCYTCSSD